MNQILREQRIGSDILPACVLKSHVLHLFAICFTSQSHKKHPKKGWTKTNKPTDMFLPTQQFRKQKSMQTRPFNVNLFRSRSPNLQNPLRSGSGRFLQAIWTSRANGSFSKKTTRFATRKNCLEILGRYGKHIKKSCML